MEAWDTQLRKGGLELAVLLLLSRRQMYGLEIIGSLTEGGFPVSEGTIYPLLSRLSGQGLIAAEWVTGNQGHPRKYYRLTAVGLEQAGRMARQWSEFAASMEQAIKAARLVTEPAGAAKDP